MDLNPFKARANNFCNSFWPLSCDQQPTDESNKSARCSRSKSWYITNSYYLTNINYRTATPDKKQIYQPVWANYFLSILKTVFPLDNCMRWQKNNKLEQAYAIRKQSKKYCGSISCKLVLRNATEKT